MTKNTRKTAYRTPAGLLVVLAMLLSLAAPARAQEQDLPTVTVLKNADQTVEGSFNLTFRLVIDPAQSDELLVSLETEQTGTWLSGTLDGQFNLSIPANRSRINFGLLIDNDAIVEADGSITLTVNPRVGYQVGDSNSVTIDVLDDDEPVTLSFADGEEIEVLENAGTVDIPVVVTVDGGNRPGTFGPVGTNNEGLPFSVSSRAGTAVSPDDYAPISVTPLLERGSFVRAGTGQFIAVHTITVAINDDEDVEDSEQFELRLEMSPGTGSITLPSQPLRIVILDDESNGPPEFGSAAVERMVAENISVGQNVGEPVAAIDPDNDSLTYSLNGPDAALFAVDPDSGQLTVSANTKLDFEAKPSHQLTVIAADRFGVTETVEVAVHVTNVEEPGEVRFMFNQPNAGVTVLASLVDPDRGVSEDTWQWSRSDDSRGPFTDIEGATESSYTPTSEDVGNFLRAIVDYSDGEGPGKSASATTTEAVLGGRCEFDTPNDASTSLSLEPGRSVTSYFCDLEDADWISLWLTAGHVYRIQISHPHGEYTPRIAGVYDADGQLITGTHSYTGNPYATPRRPGTITFRATNSGAYYLEVKPSRCCIPPRLSPPEEYEVTLTEADGPADDVPDVEEVTLEFNNHGVKVAELDRSIETEGDRDTFLLHTKAGHNYHIKMRSHPGPHGFGGIFECIHSIASASTPDQPRRGSRDCAHRPGWVVWKYLSPSADESFLITVGSDNGTGGYTLRIRDETSRPPNIHNTPLPESDLAADTSTTGRVYVNDSWINETAVLGEIDLTYDKDWYRVDLVAGVRYQIDIINEPNSAEYGIPVTLPDPYMRLYNSDGQRIEGAYDDDGGFTFSALLLYTPTRTGTYFIEVGGNGRQFGTYAVSVMDTNDTDTIHRPQGRN